MPDIQSATVTTVSLFYHLRADPIAADGSDWTVTEYYYNAGWQLLETRQAEDVTRIGSPTLAEPAVSATVHEQYVWSQRYIDAPVLRDRDSDSDGDPDDGALGKANSGLDERIYYCTDAQMSITAIVDGTPGSQTIGEVRERYLYDPYGQVTIYNPGWTATQSAATYDNAILYCGYHHDTETGLYHVRNRMHHPKLGRWLTRDPLGYVDGMSLYEYCGSGPIVAVDPEGLEDVKLSSTELKQVASQAHLGLADVADDALYPSASPGIPKQGRQTAARFTKEQLDRKQVMDFIPDIGKDMAKEVTKMLTPGGVVAGAAKDAVQKIAKRVQDETANESGKQVIQKKVTNEDGTSASLIIVYDPATQKISGWIMGVAPEYDNMGNPKKGGKTRPFSNEIEGKVVVKNHSWLYIFRWRTVKLCKFNVNDY